MKKFFYVVAVVSVSAFVACNSSKQNANQEVVVEATLIEPAMPCVNVLNGEWNVIELNGKSVTQNEQGNPFMGFDVKDKRMFGNSGCNMMSGGMEMDSLHVKSLSFGNIASTRMACPDDTIEIPFLTALNTVKSYKVLECNPDSAQSKCKVGLYNQADQLLIVLQRKGENVAK